MAVARLPALEQQLRETAKQRDDLQVQLLAAERRATIAEAERDVALRNKGSKGMRKESEGAASSPIAVAGPGLGSPSAGAGISSDSAQFLAAGLLEYGSLVTKCVERAQNCAGQLKMVFQMAHTTSLPNLRMDELPIIPTSLVDRVTQANARYTSYRVTAAQRPGWTNPLVGDASQAGLSMPDVWEKQQ